MLYISIKYLFLTLKLSGNFFFYKILYREQIINAQYCATSTTPPKNFTYA